MAIMKSVIPLIKLMAILFLGIPFTYGQKYFVYEENHAQYTSKSYVLNSEAIYPVKADISLYNIILPNPVGYGSPSTDKTLALFSVLPDLIGHEDWTEINLDTIQNSIIAIGTLRNLSYQSLQQLFDFNYGDETKYWNAYKIIVKRGAKYFAPKNCLLQFFAIRNRPDIFTNTYGTINTQQKPITIEEFLTIFKNTYPDGNFPLNIPPNDEGFDRRRDRREYLSKAFNIKDSGTFFQFWTYTDWGQVRLKTTASNPRGLLTYERGIDRFIYHPIYLIVGGSFDFYFYYYRNEIGSSAAQFKENMLKEKVIVADAFK